jgi:hypothetical protein
MDKLAMHWLPGFSERAIRSRRGCQILEFLPDQVAKLEATTWLDSA